ncbi:MAG: SH3 domain-containing protein [Pseudomonadota bacterium]
MARWLVTDGDRQFAARDLDELKELARQGQISAGSMIQPPGASDWLYATEVPELKGLVRARPATAEDDADFAQPRGAFLRNALVVVLLAVAVVGGWYFYHWATRVPDVDDLSLLGGATGLQLQEMLVTADQAALRAEPKEGARTVSNLFKDQRIRLLAKRGPWYQVQADGQKGWVAVSDVVPAYFFADARERDNYDPIYNPDRYLFVSTPRWLKLPPDNPDAANTTVFQFMLKNDSKFEMTDFRLLATISDASGRVLEEKEIAIEGSVPRYYSAVVGTQKPLDDEPEGPKRLLTYWTFSQENKDAPDEDWLRWVDGIEIDMHSSNYTQADIKLIQARAVTER